MTDQNTGPWIVLDLETEGLDQEEDSILEIAAVAIDPKTLEEKGRFHRLIMPEGGLHLTPFILNMHIKNGLLAGLATGQGVSTDRGAQDLADWLVEQGAGRARADKARLVGNSVHFDLGFLRQLSAPSALISHQIVDVTSLGLVAKSLGLPDGRSETVAHRAMADCESSLAQLRLIRAHMATALLLR